MRWFVQGWMIVNDPDVEIGDVPLPGYTITADSAGEACHEWVADRGELPFDYVTAVKED